MKLTRMTFSLCFFTWMHFFILSTHLPWFFDSLCRGSSFLPWRQLSALRRETFCRMQVKVQYKIPSAFWFLEGFLFQTVLVIIFPFNKMIQKNCGLPYRTGGILWWSSPTKGCRIADILQNICCGNTGEEWNSSLCSVWHFWRRWYQHQRNLSEGFVWQVFWTEPTGTICLLPI